MCDTIVVVNPEGVLFAKNSDRDPNEAQFPEWHPPADHSEGATVETTYLTIPQVPHTFATLLSRPFWIVNRRAIPWPPGLIGAVPFNAIRSGLRLWDRFEERGLAK